VEEFVIFLELRTDPFYGLQDVTAIDLAADATEEQILESVARAAALTISS
jgi:hypothetical protein